MQRGLQQTERVDQTASEAQLLPGGSLESRSLHTVLIQVELLLGLFADQLGLQTHKNRFYFCRPSSSIGGNVFYKSKVFTLQMSLGMSSSTRMQSWSPP